MKMMVIVTWTRFRVKDLLKIVNKIFRQVENLLDLFINLFTINLKIFNLLVRFRATVQTDEDGDLDTIPRRSHRNNSNNDLSPGNFLLLVLFQLTKK